MRGLIVCFESSIYCQAIVKQMWHCHIAYSLLAVCLTVLGLLIAMVKVNSYVFQMKLNFLRGVPCRLPAVLCYSLSLSKLWGAVLLLYSHVQSHRGVSNISSKVVKLCQRRTVVDNVFRTVRLLAWFPLQHLPWAVVHQLQLLALHGLFQPILSFWRGLWLTGCVRGGDQRWRGRILAFDGFNTENRVLVTGASVSDLRGSSWW